MNSFGAVAILSVTVCGLAQEIDTAIFSRESRKYTLLDQIKDPTERKAFERIFRERDAGKRRELAEAFLNDSPQSWLSAQAYEIAAKAAIDLEDYAAAMRLAAESLRLFPENPLLLVPLANVQAKAQKFDSAAETAKAALSLLGRFDRPSSIAENDWPGIKRQLAASCYFVLGRVTAYRGFSEKGKELLKEAGGFLLQGLRLEADQPEAIYLLGLVRLFEGNSAEAAACFAKVSPIPGPLGQQASEQLQKLRRNSAEVVFESLVRGGMEPRSTIGKPGTYAGSEACWDCHREQYLTWQRTGMGQMLREYEPERVMGDFERHNQFADDTGFPIARMILDGSRHYFELRDRDRRWQRYPVDYTIGSKWQQAYATRLEDGRIQVLPIQYNALQKRWVNYWKLIDPPGSERANVAGFHRFSSAATYQTNCAPCHTSQLHMTRRGAVEPRDLSFREAGINCEMCHGPSAEHVGRTKSGAPRVKAALEAPVEFRKIGAKDYVSICAQCHMQSAVRKPGANGEMNYSETGNSFVPAYLSRPYSEFSRKAFYKDGRFRETTFIVEAFVRTACYRRGQAHCGHCHQPHVPDPESNAASLKRFNGPDEMCLQCHGEYRNNLRAHSRHPAASEASRCVSCHMPKIMNSLLFRARTHQIDDKPDAEMTLRFGRDDSPNACLMCHLDKDGKWARSQLAAWSKPAI